jgi:hypothetical protein
MSSFGTYREEQRVGLAVSLTLSEAEVHCDHVQVANHVADDTLFERKRSRSFPNRQLQL